MEQMNIGSSRQFFACRKLFSLPAYGCSMHWGPALSTLYDDVTSTGFLHICTLWWHTSENCHRNCVLIFLKTLALYKQFTYLLTYMLCCRKQWKLLQSTVSHWRNTTVRYCSLSYLLVSVYFVHLWLKQFCIFYLLLIFSHEVIFVMLYRSLVCSTSVTWLVRNSMSKLQHYVGRSSVGIRKCGKSTSAALHKSSKLEYVDAWCRRLWLWINSTICVYIKTVFFHSFKL